MRRFVLLPLLVIALLVPVPGHTQTGGSIIGRVIDVRTEATLEGATVEVVGTMVRGVTGADGRFVLGAVPPGERTLRIHRLGYQPVVMEGVLVRTGRTQELRIVLEVAPVAVPGVVVEAQRVRLVEAEVSNTHDIVVARELRALPVDRVQQVIELTPGVSGGHFRGGRMGQEVYVVDGVELKNQFEASTQSPALELSPTALEEIEVITGGFGAQFGSALSGVVSYVTRRGNLERWDARASLLTEEWAPAALFHGFTGMSLSTGGPLRISGGTLFVDVLAHGMLDAEPRARGLTCIRETDADDDLAAEIRSLRAAAPTLLCPQTHTMLPHQRGDKLIVFARHDRPLARNLQLSATLLRNRVQRELYSPDFRYSNAGQHGQRTMGTLGTMLVEWSRNSPERGHQLSARTSAMRIDRYLGVVDPASFGGTRIGGFGLGSFEFFGEDFARSPIEQQLAEPAAVPGYEQPAGSLDNPFGLAGADIFFTGGTPHIASWARTDALSFDVTQGTLWATGSSFRAGASGKLYRVESYERTLSHLAGSSPNYARFFPAMVSGFAEARVAVADEMTFHVGVRVDAFTSGIAFRADREDFLSPVSAATWQLSVSPRLGVAMPVPGTGGNAALRFNFGYVSQPPDFRYFIDTAVGDSLRTDIRRQGNPTLSFERGKSYEVGLGTLLLPNVGAAFTLFRKELSHLVTGSMRISAVGDPLYSTDDEGTVNGAELSVRGRWSALSLRVSYALQKATGVASGFDSDTMINRDGFFSEYPLAFDRRHSIDGALLFGRAAGDSNAPWSVGLVSSVQSGYPVDRYAVGGRRDLRGDEYLPWTATVDLRCARELMKLPGCARCAWRVVADGRNLLGRSNIVAVRRDTGRLAPTLASVRTLADAMPAPPAIPAESPLYTLGLDVNRDGIITPDEFRLGRTAAALNRFDPSLFFGEPRQLRLGLEVSF